ncbi:hypothetical protein [Ruthenibacterium lactatiformans]|jgi:hypothetical protein|uniref:hypothetical protein n=1 Tax=Ruthenibacterium lactatiformans TaxID=1550024 RepID=UPI003AB9AD70
MIRDILKDFTELVQRFNCLSPRKQETFLNFCEAMENPEFVAKLDDLTPTGKTLPPLDIIIALMDETSDRLNQQEDKTK